MEHIAEIAGAQQETMEVFAELAKRSEHHLVADNMTTLICEIESSRFEKIREHLKRLDAQGRFKRIIFNADNKAEIQGCLSEIQSVVAEMQLSMQVMTQSKILEVQDGLRDVQGGLQVVHSAAMKTGKLALDRE